MDATSQQTAGVFSRLRQQFRIALFILLPCFFPFLAASFLAHGVLRKLLQESLWGLQNLWDPRVVGVYSTFSVECLRNYRPGIILDLIAARIPPSFWAITTYASHLREVVSTLLRTLSPATVLLPAGIPSPSTAFLFFAETVIAGGWAWAPPLAALVASFFISTWTRPMRSIIMLALGLALGVLISSQYVHSERVCHVHAPSIPAKGLRITCEGEYMCSYWNAVVPGMNLTTP